MSELTQESNEEIKSYRFYKQMLIEMEHNRHKGSVLDWGDFNEMITELEYHKAKMMIAVRLGDKLATKEYIADCACILMAIGNKMKLYEEETKDLGFIHVMSKGPGTIVGMRVEDQSTDFKKNFY